MVVLAAFYGEPAIMRILLRAGANPNAQSLHGMTALAEAAIDLIGKEVNPIEMIQSDLSTPGRKRPSHR